MSERREGWPLPEAVFDITPQPLALVKNGLDAAIQSGMMKPNSYRMCPNTGAIIVDAIAVNEIATNFFDEERKVADKVADEIVAQSLRQYSQQMSAPTVVELPVHEMPVMLSA